MMKKILLVACLLGIILLSGCTKEIPKDIKCSNLCSKIELEQPPKGDYLIKGVWNENAQTCTCKTFVESTPTFKIDISGD